MIVMLANMAHGVNAPVLFAVKQANNIDNDIIDIQRRQPNAGANYLKRNRAHTVLIRRHILISMMEHPAFDSILTLIFILSQIFCHTFFL